MVWYFVLCPDDAKQDPVVYGTEFGVVLLVKGPRILYPYQEERYFRLLVENAIGTQLHDDPINSGLTQWRIWRLKKIMDAPAEIEKNPVSKHHQIQPEYGE